jgi:NADH-quinone oxidoreductase subunit J
VIGAFGVVLSSNPVHAALSLVATLFGIAVLFVAQDANFLAAVQVIVYAGAIVVLFLFVLMLLGVDKSEDLTIEPLGGGQRIAAAVVGLCILALPLMALASTDGEATGARPAVASVSSSGVATETAGNRIVGTSPDIDQLGRSLFTDYLFAFEATSALLVIAVVGAVVLSRKVKRADMVDDPLEAAASEPQASDAMGGYAKGGDAPLEAQESEQASAPSGADG